MIAGVEVGALQGKKSGWRFGLLSEAWTLAEVGAFGSIAEREDELFHSFSVITGCVYACANSTLA